MKYKNDVKLNIISNIDEKIIDEATDMKISLLQRVKISTAKTRKRFIVIVAAAACLALMLSGFFVLLGSIIGADTVPVYQGMTIRKNPAPSLYADRHTDSMLKLKFLSTATLPRHDKDEHNKPTLEKDIADIVSLDIISDDEIKYYVEPGETFIIEVHISNPDNFEIQSFTLNGTKYANYMFKEGSTMELLLLEVTAPKTSGYTEYTIDAIKYIDGTEIKDVDMSEGNKSIKAGVAYSTAPSAEVLAQTVSTTSLELSIKVSDPLSLIGDNALSVYLSDGKQVIDSKPLTVGNNIISFDGLLMSTDYEYGVLTLFDMVDGRNMHEEWLLKNTFTTGSAFGITDVVTTKDSISFKVNKFEESGKITSVSIYDTTTNELVKQGDANTVSFDSLLSDHKYKLCVDFIYISKDKETAAQVMLECTTKKNSIPSITFADITTTDVSIAGKYTFVDKDSIGAVTSVGIYKGGALVKGSPEKKINFSGLEYYTDYQIVISYTYDLNDGKGVQTDAAVYDFTTSPHLIFNSCDVLNSSAVKEGDTIFLQINITNPNQVVYKKVVINGKEYDVVKSSSTATKLVCEIAFSNQFEGGNTTLTVEKVISELDNKTYTVEPKLNNTANVFIYGQIKIDDIYAVVNKNGDYTKIELYVFPSDDAYILIKLRNKTGYNIELKDANNENIPYIKLDAENYLIEKENWQSGLSKIKYSIEDFSNSLSCNIDLNYNIKELNSDDIHYISTADDLLNMNGSFYYELKNDIDLSGKVWRGADFSGIFDGKGYSIKNMSYVGGASTAVGLFSRGEGIIKNLNLINANFIVQGNVAVGGIVGSGSGNLIIDNCTIDANSSIFGDYSVGGIVGLGAEVRNCVNNATISSKGIAGGIAGQAVSVTNCVNNGSVSGGTRFFYDGKNLVGGIVGYAESVMRCTNTATVTGTYDVGGIVGRCTSISNCSNSGTVSGDFRVGGICGRPIGDLSITNCMNNASVSCNDLICGAGGILGCPDLGEESESATITNCVNIGDIILKDIVSKESGISSPAYTGNNAKIVNCHSLGANTSADELSEKQFYIDLGFDEELWDLDDLDIENGKYPKLK